jgi:hypothetical protein
VKQAMLAFSFVMLWGCIDLEKPTPPTQSQLVVHAVLDARVSLQTILIARSRGGAQQTAAGSVSDDEPVSGATVTVTAPNGAVMIATEGQANSPLSGTLGTYFYTPSQSGVALAGGGTYRLFVRTPDGEEATGTTTIPLPPTGGPTTLPSSSFSRQNDTLRLRWPSADGARSYELLIRSRPAGEYRIFTDTVAAVPGTTLTINGDTLFPIGGRVTILVSAVDANYYDYYRAQSDPFAGAAPSHLQGAVGVFGSVVLIRGYQLHVR